MRKCPFCGEIISGDSPSCSFCGETLPSKEKESEPVCQQSSVKKAGRKSKVIWIAVALVVILAASGICVAKFAFFKGGNESSAITQLTNEQLNFIKQHENQGDTIVAICNDAAQKCFFYATRLRATESQSMFGTIVRYDFTTKKDSIILSVEEGFTLGGQFIQSIDSINHNLFVITAFPGRIDGAQLIRYSFTTPVQSKVLLDYDDAKLLMDKINRKIVVKERITISNGALGASGNVYALKESELSLDNNKLKLIYDETAKYEEIVNRVKDAYAHRNTDAVYKEYFSAGLYKLFDKVQRIEMQTESLILDWNIWILGQDENKFECYVNNINFESEVKAEAYVEIFNFGMLNDVTLVMLKEGGKWKIDDFKGYDGKGSSFKTLLMESVKKYGHLTKI